MKPVKFFCKFQNQEEYLLYIELLESKNIYKDNVNYSDFDTVAIYVTIDLENENSYYLVADSNTAKSWFRINDDYSRNYPIYGYQEALEVFHENRGNISFTLLGLL